MATRKRTKQTTPLIVEDHPDDYTGFPFITLLQFNQDNVLCIVDTANDKMVKAYVLDLCACNGIDEEQILSVAKQWYETSRDKYPLSIAFAKLQMSSGIKAIYRNYNIEYITRVIGPLPKFDMKEKVQIRRRRKKTLPNNVELKIYNFEK